MCGIPKKVITIKYQTTGDSCL